MDLQEIRKPKAVNAISRSGAAPWTTLPPGHSHWEETKDIAAGEAFLHIVHLRSLTTSATGHGSNEPQLTMARFVVSIM